MKGENGLKGIAENLEPNRNLQMKLKTGGLRKAMVGENSNPSCSKSCEGGELLLFSLTYLWGWWKILLDFEYRNFNTLIFCKYLVKR